MSNNTSSSNEITLYPVDIFCLALFYAQGALTIACAVIFILVLLCSAGGQKFTEAYYVYVKSLALEHLALAVSILVIVTRFYVFKNFANDLLMNIFRTVHNALTSVDVFLHVCVAFNRFHAVVLSPTYKSVWTTRRCAHCAGWSFILGTAPAVAYTVFNDSSFADTYATMRFAYSGVSFALIFAAYAISCVVYFKRSKKLTVASSQANGSWHANAKTQREVRLMLQAAIVSLLVLIMWATDFAPLRRQDVAKLVLILTYELGYMLINVVSMVLFDNKLRQALRLLVSRGQASSTVTPVVAQNGNAAARGHDKA